MHKENIRGTDTNEHANVLSGGLFQMPIQEKLGDKNGSTHYQKHAF
jgi:hypothetical protein